MKGTALGQFSLQVQGTERRLYVQHSSGLGVQIQLVHQFFGVVHCLVEILVLIGAVLGRAGESVGFGVMNVMDHHIMLEIDVAIIEQAVERPAFAGVPELAEQIHDSLPPPWAVSRSYPRRMVNRRLRLSRGISFSSTEKRDALAYLDK